MRAPRSGIHNNSLIEDEKKRGDMVAPRMLLPVLIYCYLSVSLT